MASFTPGNIVVYRVGAGSASLTNAATAVFLDEYTASGALVQSIALPTADNGANQMLTASGTAGSEGELNLSSDGHYLVLTGYDAATGTAGVASTTGANVARVVGLVDASGAINTATALTDAASGNNIRSADSTNGVDLWVAGGAGGVRYTTVGATTSTQLSTTVANIRDVDIFYGQIYVTDASGSAVRVGAVGAGEPTTSGQTITTLPGLPTSGGSPYDLFMADLSASVGGLDTLYVADDGVGITKYALVNGTWVSKGVVGSSSDSYRGLTGEVNADGSVTLFATGNGGSSGSGGGKLVTLTDSAGYNGAFAASVTTLATAAANTAFRGVAFAPSAVADLTAPTLVALNPADNAAGVAGSTNLTLTFSENVKLGAGAIQIYRDSDGALVQTIDVQSGAVSVSGAQVIVNPPVDLAGGTAYHVDIDAGAVTDLAGNAFAGISNATDYNFSTAVAETQTLSFTSTALSQAEGDSGTKNFVFTVQRAGGTTGDAHFTVNFAQGATDASDYAGGVLPAATIAGVIAAGQASATVAIAVAGDLTPEANESFSLTLAGTPTNATPGVTIGLDSANLTATGTIVDDDSFTHIYTIQGSGPTSPLAGQSVTTRGVVTAIDTNGGESSRGFYIQDATGDGDSATSDAIFVYLPASSSFALPTLGDLVSVTGVVSEYKSSSAYLDSPTLTEMSVTGLSDLGVGPTIAPVQIGGVGGLTPPTSDLAAGAAFWESLESMKVTLVAPTAVSATDSTYLETYVAVSNGAGGVDATGMNARGGLTVTGGAPDYGNTDVVGGDFNPELVQIDTDSGMISGFTKPVVNVGAQFSDVTGIMSYAYGVEQVLATQAYSVTAPSALQKETTALTGSAHQLTVADYNVENLQPTDTARIAAHASEIFHNLGAPDIVALQEIQDNDGATISSVISASTVLQTLVDDLNAQAAAAGGSAHYAWIDNPFLNVNATTGLANGGQPGGNIRCAYIYRTDRVSFDASSLRTIGADGSALTAADPTQVDASSNNPFYSARPSLVATFSFNGQDVMVINNHFSSKGGSGVLGGTDPTPLDAYEDKRAAQAQAVNTYVDGLLAANPDAKIVVAGDLNEFQFEEPLKVLEGLATVSGYATQSAPAITGTYTPTPDAPQVLNDLTNTLPASEQYDYNFDGNAEDLDHILVSNALASGAAFDVVHINSEFSDQTSDHDPLVTQLTLDAPICFMAGTMIAAPGGEVAVEALKRGDLVLTAEGRVAPVRWLGRQTIAAPFADPARCWPIRVRRNALGDNWPCRDLLLSPDHALLVDQLLVHAGALVNGTTILRETEVPQSFVYYHVELADHGLILAENAPAESFIDNVDRLAFDNWDEHQALYPDGAPLNELAFPRVKTARQLPRGQTADKPLA